MFMHHDLFVRVSVTNDTNAELRHRPPSQSTARRDATHQKHQNTRIRSGSNRSGSRPPTSSPRSARKLSDR